MFPEHRIVLREVSSNYDFDWKFALRAPGTIQSCLKTVSDISTRGIRGNRICRPMRQVSQRCAMITRSLNHFHLIWEPLTDERCP